MEWMNNSTVSPEVSLETYRQTWNFDISNNTDVCGTEPFLFYIFVHKHWSISRWGSWVNYNFIMELLSEEMSASSEFINEQCRLLFLGLFQQWNGMRLHHNVEMMKNKIFAEFFHFITGISLEFSVSIPYL